MKVYDLTTYAQDFDEKEIEIILYQLFENRGLEKLATKIEKLHFFLYLISLSKSHKQINKIAYLLKDYGTLNFEDNFIDVDDFIKNEIIDTYSFHPDYWVPIKAILCSNVMTSKILYIYADEDGILLNKQLETVVCAKSLTITTNIDEIRTEYVKQVVITTVQEVKEKFQNENSNYSENLYHSYRIWLNTLMLGGFDKSFININKENLESYKYLHVEREKELDTAKPRIELNNNYPNFFKEYKYFLFAECLIEKVNKKKKLTECSFLYRQMVEDGYIDENFPKKTIVDFFAKYDLSMDRVLTYDDCKNFERIREYSITKDLFQLKNNCKL